MTISVCVLSRRYPIALQLGVISSIYLVFRISFGVVVIDRVHLRGHFLAEAFDLLRFLVYLVPLLSPFACLPSMSNLIAKIIKYLLSLLNIKVEHIHEHIIAKQNELRQGRKGPFGAT